MHITPIIKKICIRITTVLILLVLFASTIPEIETAGGRLIPLPLGSLFSIGGIVVLLLIIGLLITIIQITIGRQAR